MLDSYMTKRGVEYLELKKSYVIFICTFDPYLEGDTLYELEWTVKGKPHLNGRDEQYRIFLNTKGSNNGISEELEELFRYINEGSSAVGSVENKDSLAGLLDGYVVNINEDNEWKGERMKYECDMADSYYKGKKEGEVRGEARGETKATSRIVKSMYSDGLSAEKISQYASIPVEQVHSILRTSIKT